MRIVQLVSERIIELEGILSNPYTKFRHLVESSLQFNRELLNYLLGKH